jgi:hypothetical protein
MPATAHTSSFSPPGAPETPMALIHPRALRQFVAAMQPLPGAACNLRD